MSNVACLYLEITAFAAQHCLGEGGAERTSDGAKREHRDEKRV